MINVRSMAPTVSGAGHSSAKRAFCRLVATLLAAAGLGGWPADPAEGQTSDESATYTVTFQGEWTISSTPGGVVSGAHFTTLIGAVHNSQVTFWRSGGTASPGIENVAEIGGTSTFRSEIRAKGSDVASVVQASPGSGGRGRATFDIDVTNDHPLLTLVSMIGPSPDWFVGVSPGCPCSMADSGARSTRSTCIRTTPGPRMERSSRSAILTRRRGEPSPASGGRASSRTHRWRP